MVKLEKAGTRLALLEWNDCKQGVARKREIRCWLGLSMLKAGTYYLVEPLVFTVEDAGASYAAAPRERDVISGGGWTSVAGRCGVFCRCDLTPDDSIDSGGFRLVRRPSPELQRNQPQSRKPSQ